MLFCIGERISLISLMPMRSSRQSFLRSSYLYHIHINLGMLRQCLVTYFSLLDTFDNVSVDKTPKYYVKMKYKHIRYPA